MTTMRSASWISVCAIAGAVATAGGCAVGGGEEDERGAQSADAPVYLDQGWDAATREAFYTTTQGSRMLPYAWFINLEEAGSKQKFKAASNMRRMGFLVDERSAANPDKLPVGFTKDENPTKGAAVGLSCAACHTGEIKYAGKRVRIDGGQSLGDLEQLQNGIRDALSATLADGEKFERFAEDVLGDDASAASVAALRAAVVVKRDWWSRRIERSAGLSAHGPSRTDAFTIIGNEVLCEQLDPRNCTPKNANGPTQFPFLWGTPDMEWAQYNSSVHSPIGRNVGEVTGVFAENGFDAGGVTSTANLPNLHKLEGLVAKLRAPQWPADVLGPINATAAAAGEVIYETKCSSCHAEVAPRSAPNKYGKTFAQMNTSAALLPPFSGGAPLLGTDPMAAMGFAQRRAYPGPFAPFLPPGSIGADGKAAGPQLLAVSGGMIIRRFFAENGIAGLAALTYLSFRESRTAPTPQLLTYKARPLNGIAFTAPYLHNGSVPSLYELLLPPAERTKSFAVGNAEYDPIHVGYSTEANSKTVVLDTTKLGNSNGGHIYGTDLNDGERMALIEYMKTL